MSDSGVKNRWIARKEKLLKRVKDSSINGAVFHSFIHSFTHSLNQSIMHVHVHIHIKQVVRPQLNTMT